MSHLLPGGSLMDSGQLSSVVLSAATTQLLVRHQAVVAEILRHFWTCFPIISPTLEQKVRGRTFCHVVVFSQVLRKVNFEVVILTICSLSRCIVWHNVWCNTRMSSSLKLMLRSRHATVT